MNLLSDPRTRRDRVLVWCVIDSKPLTHGRVHMLSIRLRVAQMVALIGASFATVAFCCCIDVGTRLPAGQMRASRGGDGNKDKAQYYCDDFKDANGKGTVLTRCGPNDSGLACTTCGTAKTHSKYQYDDTGIATGGYIKGAAGGGDCGTIWQGVCGGVAAPWECMQINNADTKTACKKPPGIPPAQPL